jgi:biotin transport system substrate-specific component
MEVIRKSYMMDTTQTTTSILAQAGWISLFAALTAAGAQVQIPFTLQTFFVLLSGAFLGARNGFIAQVAYITIGALGMPVFSGATFGLVKVFGVTGGYLMSFPIAAALVGYMLHIRKGYLWTLFSMFLALIVVFTCGSLYLNVIAIHNLPQAFASGFFLVGYH